MDCAAVIVRFIFKQSEDGRSLPLPADVQNEKSISCQDTVPKICTYYTQFGISPYSI